jgi:hypothetical protein
VHFKMASSSQPTPTQQVRLPSMWKLQQIQSVIDYITS